jgi:hypothetical protein
MSFSPLFSSYINFNTASYGPSSSLGPLDVAKLLNNTEWLYHNQAQVRINHGRLSHLYLNLTNSNRERNLMGSIGPFPITFDKDGNPLSLFIAAVIQLESDNGIVSTTTGTFDIQLRYQNQDGIALPSEIASFTTSSKNSGGSYNTTWSAFVNSASMTVTSGSVLETKKYVYDPLYLQTRSTRSISEPNENQLSYLGFIDCYFQIVGFTGVTQGNTTAQIVGLYAREISKIQ